MKKVCIIGVYFGKLPEYFDLWLLSVKHNPSVNFLMITDQDFVNNCVNLKVIKSDLKNIKKLIQKKLKMKISMRRPYKLCDFKPLYGIIFSDEIIQYDYWGECDFDVIFGNLRKFFNIYSLEKYDKFFNRGHLTLYKNTEEVNNRYKLFKYKEILKSPLHLGFDEVGINILYKEKKYPYMNKFYYADIDIYPSDIRLVERSGHDECKNRVNQIFYWENGGLYRDSWDKNKIIRDEYAYIHLQKRKLPKPFFETKEKISFYITSKGFYEKKGNTTLKTIQELNKKDLNEPQISNQTHKFFNLFLFMRSFWFGRKFLNFLCNLKITYCNLRNKFSKNR